MFFDIAEFLAEILLDFMELRKDSVTENKILKLEKEVTSLKKKKETDTIIEKSLSSTTYEEMVKMDSVLGYAIFIKKEQKIKIYFKDENNLKEILENCIYQYGYRLKKIFLIESFNGDVFNNIRIACSQYANEYLSAPSQTSDIFLIKRREHIRNKNKYYDNYVENEKNKIKEIEKMNFFSKKDISIMNNNLKHINFDKIRNEPISGCDIFFN